LKRTISLKEKVSHVQQDWSTLESKTDVDVIGPDGTNYEAVVHSMTQDSRVVWVPRQDVGSRHLLDHCDGVRDVSSDLGVLATRGRLQR
jgi:hypothetical protein